MGCDDNEVRLGFPCRLYSIRIRCLLLPSTEWDWEVTRHTFEISFDVYHDSSVFCNLYGIFFWLFKDSINAFLNDQTVLNIRVNYTWHYCFKTFAFWPLILWRYNRFGLGLFLLFKNKSFLLKIVFSDFL